MDLLGKGPQERAVGARECGADHGFTGDALLLLLSGCSRCSSGLLEHYSLLPLFRGIIPAWLVRTSEDRMDVA